MKKRMAKAVAFVALAVVALLTARSAVAGIGPAGFSYYARQGIVGEMNKIYGKGNSPWMVSCGEVPDYRRLTDTVTCHIREK